MPRPFRRHAFGSLPERPRRPHGYDRSEPYTLQLNSAVFGRMQVHVRTYGQGPPLLLVHGLMTSSYSWRYLIEDLGQHHRLIMPDLPGAGLTDKPRHGSFRAPDLARWIGEFQQAMDLVGVPAVGNSMGGYLCMLAAMQRPESFSRLVNIHSPGLAMWRFHALSWGLQLPFAKLALSWMIRRDPLAWAHRHLHYYDETLKSLEEAHAYGDPLASEDGAWSLIRYLAETFDPRDLRSFETELLERRARGELFPVPLLMVYAKQDPMVPPVVGARLHRLMPETSLVWVDDTSHFMQVDSPEKVVPLLTGFFQDKGLIAP